MEVIELSQRAARGLITFKSCNVLICVLIQPILSAGRVAVGPQNLKFSKYIYFNLCASIELSVKFLKEGTRPWASYFFKSFAICAQIFF